MRPYFKILISLGLIAVIFIARLAYLQLFTDRYALNAANEIAVEAFLDERLSFRAMSDLIATALESHRAQSDYDLSLLEAVDAEVRQQCREQIAHL